MAYTNNNGQVRIGVRSGITNSPIVQPAFSASLLQSLYGVWNGDTNTTELDKSLFGVWNGDTTYTSLDVDVISAYNGENTANDSKGTNHGTLVNGATFSTSGKIGSSFYCDGINDYVQFPNNSLNLTGDFSIGLWVNVSTISTWQNYMYLIHNLTQDASGKYYGYRLYLNGNAYVFQIGNGTTTLDTVYYNAGYDVSAQISPVQNHVWKNIVITRKSGQVTKMYISGNKINPSYNLKAQNNSALSPVYQSTHTPYLGRWSNVITMVDCLTFWNRELSISDIDKFYNYNSTSYYSNVNSGVYYYGGDGLQYPFSAQVPSANDSFGTNNGSPQGGLTYTTGKIGTAFQFNGTNAYVALPDNIFNFTGDFSASAWFYTPSAAYTHSGIVGNYNDATSTGWGIYTYQNRLYAQLANAGGKYSTAFIDNSVVGSWNHVTMVFKKGTGFYLYMNGELKNSSTNNANAGISPVYSSTQKSYIGLLNYSGDWWYAKNGYKIDGVNVWNRAINIDDVTQLYNSGTGAQYPFTGTFSSAINQLGIDNGTLMNGCYLSNGKIGKAFTFDGVNDYVDLGDIMDIGLSSWSYAFWLKANVLNPSTYQTVFSKSRSAGVTGRVWCTMYGNNLQFNFHAGLNNGGDVIHTQSVLSFNINTWYHIVCVLDRNDKLKMYINGSLATTNVVLADMLTLASNNLIPYLSVNYNTNIPFRIGTYTAADNVTPISFFNGSIDGFSVWNRVLNDSEISELYNSGNGKQITATPIVQSGLVLNLDASRTSSYTGTGTTWTDISGNSNNGTLVNGPVFGTASGGVITFDGINDYVDLGNPSTIQFTSTSAFSIGVWIKHTSTTPCNILSKQLNSVPYNGWGLGVNSGGNKLQFFTYDAGGKIVDFPDIYNNNTWNYISVSRLSDNVSDYKLYVNGVSVPSTIITNLNNSNLASSTNLQISGRGGANNIWGGSLSIVQIYNRGLSASEVLQNFNATKSRFGL